MARTAITVTTLTPNAATANPAGTNVDPTNGMVVTGVPLEELLLRVTNTFDGTKVVTVKAGDNPPALEAGMGDLAVTMADGDPTAAVQWLGPFTSGRFAQADGSLEIDVAASMTGTIAAFRIPRTA